MKKTLLAAALAAGSFGVAQAQTSVTLFGIVDGGLEYTQYKVAGGAKASRFGLADGGQAGNRFGLRGAEDLGGGLRAEFMLSNSFTLADGALPAGNRLFHREASLSLVNDSWGRVKIGRQSALTADFLSSLLVPWGNSYKESAISSTFTSAATRYTDNVIRYETPVFSGFRAGIWYSFNATAGQAFKISGQPDNTNVKATAVALRYSNGPLQVGAAYDHADRDDFAKSLHAWVVAGSYDFDVAKIHLGVGQDYNGVFNTRGSAGNTALGSPGITQQGYTYLGGKYKTNNYSVSFAVPTDTGSLMFGWHGSRLGSGPYKNGRAKSSINTYSAVYNYPLSKRTAWYTTVDYVQGYAFNNIKATQLFTGLNHRF